MRQTFVDTRHLYIILYIICRRIIIAVHSVRRRVSGNAIYRPKTARKVNKSQESKNKQMNDNHFIEMKLKKKKRRKNEDYFLLDRSATLFKLHVPMRCAPVVDSIFESEFCRCFHFCFHVVQRLPLILWCAVCLCCVQWGNRHKFGVCRPNCPTVKFT